MAYYRVFGALLLLSISAQGSQVLNGKKQSELLHEKGNAMIGKIIKMLGEEKDKIAEDIVAESTEMDEYFNFCHREQDDKNYAISQAARKIDDLSALIESNTAQMKALDEELYDLGKEMAKHEDRQATEDKRRAEEKAEFKVREHEAVVMVEELERMTGELEQQMAAMTTPPPAPGTATVPPAVEALLEVSNARQRLSGFWDEQAKNAKEEIKARAHDQVRAQKRAQLAAKFYSEVQMHPEAMLQDDADLPLETMKRLQQGLSRTLEWLDQDPKAAGPDGSFVQENGGVPVSAKQFDQHQVNNAKNMETFEKLKEKSEKALQRERDNESETQHEYMLDMQARQHEMNICSDKIDKAKEDRARYQEETAKAEGDKAKAEESKAADEKYLGVLVNECTAASDAWDNRKKDAKDEQAAISKAQEILSSRVKVFLQASQRTHKAKQPEHVASEEQVRQTLIAHFRNLGSKFHSLSLLNMANAASAQPLEKVKGLLKELIDKLTQEAAEAASTHAFCEEENKKNKAALETTNGKLEKVKLRLEKASAKKATLADEVTTLTEEIAEIDAADAEALEIRQAEHKTFAKNEADFKEAESAVLDAIDVLKDFYGSSVLIQTGNSIEAPGDAVVTTTKSPIAVQAPDMGGAKTDSAGGILMIMDTMASEFAKTVAELQRAEREGQKAYDKMKNDNEVSKATKEAEIKASESEIAMLSVNIGDNEDDVAMNQDELAAINTYIEKLKPTCVGVVLPYAERKARREAEIEGLKQALDILEETSGTLKSVSFLQMH